MALPGPALTPYLVGLLVLLGMLGTLFGMVVTFKGTGAALESAADLQAIRASLAAPIQGLGFSFGTSIAGVSTSAMLGLLSALCRRERLQAAQALDAQIATTLRLHSHAHQREETLALLRRQAEAMPLLVDRLQAMMTTLEQQSQASAERQIASQQAFLGQTEAAYARLASSVGQSLQDSAAESARTAGAALQPVVEATLAGLAREAASVQETVKHAVRQQLDSLSTGFDTTAANVADIWSRALAAHRQSNEALAEQWRTSLDQLTAAFDQRSASLLEGISARLETTAGSVSQAWTEALSRQDQTHETLTGQHRRALEAATATFEQHAATLQRTLHQSHEDLRAGLASQDQQRLAAWTDTLGSIAATLRQEWEQAGAHTASHQQAICETLARTAHDISARTQAHASDTIAEISRLVQAASEAPQGGGRSHRRAAPEASRQHGPRHRDAGRAQPPAGNPGDPPRCREPRVHRAAVRRRRADLDLGGSARSRRHPVRGQGGGRRRAAGHRCRAGHRQRGRGGQPGRSIRRGRAAVRRIERPVGRAPAAPRSGAGQIPCAQR